MGGERASGPTQFICEGKRGAALPTECFTSARWPTCCSQRYASTPQGGSLREAATSLGDHSTTPNEAGAASEAIRGRSQGQARLQDLKRHRRAVADDDMRLQAQDLQALEPN